MRVFKLALIAIAVFYLSLYARSANAEEYSSYLNEFNNPGETTELQSRWVFVTSDGLIRTVDVYRYCSEQCVFVAFDVEHREIISDEQTQKLFENHILNEYVVSGMISEESYDIYLKESMVCDFLVPEKLAVEGGKEVTRATINYLPKVLPENAANLVKAIPLSAIPRGNAAVIVVGVACIGGNWVESSAASTMESCKRYVSDIRNRRIYEGEAEDLILCHSAAIDGLESVKMSPNLWLEHAEVTLSESIAAAGYFFEGLSCNLRKLLGDTECEPEPPEDLESSLEIIEKQIESMSGNMPDHSLISSKASTFSSESINRINQKDQEARSEIGTLELRIEQFSIAMSEFVGIDDMFLDIFFHPYNLTEEASRLESSVNFLERAKSNYSEYRYNSAIISAEDGIKQLDLADMGLTEKTSVPRQLNLVNILIILIIVIVVVIILYIKLSY